MKKRKADSTDNINSAQTTSINNSSDIGTLIYVFNGIMFHQIH
jgi:hypothetical protein